MLYRNNEEFKLDSKVAAQFDKPMIWKMPRNCYRYDSINKIIEVRNTHSIPTVYTANETLGGTKKETGRNTIRFATSVRPHEDNAKILIYEPLFLVINNRGFITVEDIETNWFLATNPNNLTNPNRPRGHKVLYEQHEPQKIAIEKMAGLSQRAKAMALLVGDVETMLTDIEIMPIAFNYFYSKENHGFFSSPEDMTKEEVRYKLTTLAERDPKTFLQIHTENTTAVRSLIQKAVAKKIVIFHSESFEWLFIDGITGAEVMLKLDSNDPPAESLIKYLEDDDIKGYQPRIRKRILDLDLAVASA